MRLAVTCSKCKISKYCEARGSSPLTISNKNEILCNLINGYGRKPAPVDKLSEHSKQLYDSQGKCLTIAEVPYMVDGFLITKIVKIFHPPILHARESSVMQLEHQPKNHK